MESLHFVSWFFGGALLANALPHFVSGLMGQPFQSPFAHPHGQGHSSSTVNVLWGAFNLMLAWLLVCRVGSFDLHCAPHAATLGLGMLLCALFNAWGFGRFNGGNLRGEAKPTR